MDLDAFGWLLTDAGQELLAEAEVALDQGPLKAADELRKTTTSERAAVALSQAELRRKGAEKFGALAAHLYFTPDGLEQATRLPVAEHRAARLKAFEAASVIDLMCGIGGDLIAFGRAGLTAAGVDISEERAAVASANLDALHLSGVVQIADATTIDSSPFAVAFADPARRSGRGRELATAGWTPPWEWVSTLFQRDSCVKVAPGIDHSLIPDGVEAEWVSDHGEVKEAALWSGALATVSRRATVIGDGGLATLTDEDDPGPETVGVSPVGDYLYEPDGAVIRAGLVTAVASGVAGSLIDEHIAYVTSASSFKTPFARSYAVLETLPYREKQLKAALRERGIGRLTIKKRGVDIVPEELRKRLDLKGDNEGTIVMTRASGDGICLLVEPF